MVYPFQQSLTEGSKVNLSSLISDPEQERSVQTKQLLNLATSKDELGPTPSSKKIVIGIPWALQFVFKGVKSLEK